MLSYEAVFLPRVRKLMQQCLAFADRLMHFMWASILLGLFYTRAGRTLEAYSIISATVRFAIGCGVDSEGEQEHVSAILPPVMDKMDSRERAIIWGAIYLLDRTLCSIANLPSSFPPAVCRLPCQRSMKRALIISTGYRTYASSRFWSRMDSKS
jgi:hypothetical protein